MDVETVLKKILDVCNGLPSQTEWLFLTSEVSVIAGSYYGGIYITDHPDIQTDFIKFCASKNICKESDVATKDCNDKLEETIKVEKDTDCSYNTLTPLSGYETMEGGESGSRINDMTLLKDKHMFLSEPPLKESNKKTKDDVKHKKRGPKKKGTVKEKSTQKDKHVDGEKTKNESKRKYNKKTKQVNKNCEITNGNEDNCIHDALKKEEEIEMIRNDDVQKEDSKDEKITLTVGGAAPDAPPVKIRKKYTCKKEKKKSVKEISVCDFCGRTFNSSRSLQYHIRREHTGEKPYKCEVCQETFYSSRTMYYHKKHTHNPVDSICEICGLKYPSEEALKSHIYQHKMKLKRKEVQCELCKKILPSQKSYLRHFARNHLNSSNTSSFPINVVKCEECGKIFTDNWRLRNHVRVHTGEKPHKCSHCGKDFADRGNMRVHERSHTDTERHECVCGKSFVQARSMRIHQRTCAVYIQGESMKDGDVSTQNESKDTQNSDVRNTEAVSSFTLELPQAVSYITHGVVIDYSAAHHQNWTVCQLDNTKQLLQCAEEVQIQFKEEQLECNNQQLECNNEQLECNNQQLECTNEQLQCT